MRPIDADEVIRYSEIVEDIQGGICFCAVRTDLIRLAPTLDVVTRDFHDACLKAEHEFEQAEWIKGDSPVTGNANGHFWCSKCKGTVPYKSPFCPNCGREMRNYDA